MPAQIVFVVGTGRSGTHFLTRCLIEHPRLTDLSDGRENPFVFESVTRLATGQSRRFDRGALRWKYRWLRLRAGRRILVDQSHPNLWNYNLLAPPFTGSTWFALVRDPRAVVASMMAHAGVRRRSENWRTYPFPNMFLGVTEDNRSVYEAASLVGRSAYRWLSHGRRILELARSGEVTPVSYEALVHDPQAAMDRLFDLIGVPPIGPTDFGADAASLSKWTSVLTDEEANEVLSIADSDGVLSGLRQRCAG